jgi:hypothetical protein
LIRRTLFIVTLFAASCTLAQQQSAITPSTATPPGAVPAAQDPKQPQNQMPPDTQAPAPTPSAKPQSDSIPPPSSSEPRFLKGNTEIRATLDTPLSTKTSKVGDRFTATVSAPVRDSIGNIIVPAGSKLNGQVSESANEKIADAIKDMGHLDLRFTDIQLPNGTDVPLSATLISVHNIKPAPRTESPTQSSAIGANLGLAGAFGPPLRGLAVGTEAGGGYVLATNGKQVNLPAECGLRLRVDRNTPLP